MGVVQNIVITAHYTWDTAPGDWDHDKAGSDFDNYAILSADCDAQETLGFAESAGKTASKGFSESFGVSETGFVKDIISNEAVSLNIAETYIDLINFVHTIQESVSFAPVGGVDFTRPYSESFSMSSASVRELIADAVQTIGFAELREDFVDYVNNIAESIAISETASKHMFGLNYETLTLAERMVRAANAVLFDILITEYSDTDPVDWPAWAKKAPPGYTEFTQLVPGDREYEKAIIGVKVTGPTTVGRPGISSLTLHVDVPDVVERGNTVTTAGAWKTITFDKDFKVAPEVNVQYKSGGTPGFPDVQNVTATSFEVAVRDASSPSTLISGTVGWAAIGR